MSTVPKPLWMGLAKRLRSARKALGLSAEAISTSAGLHPKMAAGIESQGPQLPTIEEVERLAAALGVPVLWLAYGPKGHLPFTGGHVLERAAETPVPAGPQPFRRLCDDCPRQLVKQITEDSIDLLFSSVIPVPQFSEEFVADIAEGRRVPLIDEAEYLSRRLNAAPAFLPYGFGFRGYGHSEEAEPQDYGDGQWVRPKYRALRLS